MNARTSISCYGKGEADNGIPLGEKPQESTPTGRQTAPRPPGKPILEVGINFFNPESVDPKSCHFQANQSLTSISTYLSVEADNEVPVLAHAAVVASQREFFSNWSM